MNSTQTDTPIKRRPRKLPGKTASLSITRKVGFVVQSLLQGRPDSTTTKACLDGPDGAEVRHGVWRRARLNARLALLLSDEWKREAEGFENRLISVNSSQKNTNT